MTTLLGFSTFPPGTTFLVPLATRDTAKEEAVSKRIPRTFADVPEGYMFDNDSRLGVARPFLKLRGTHQISTSSRADFRKVNAIHCLEGEPVFFSANTPVHNVRSPKRSHGGRRLRREFFVVSQGECHKINGVHENADVAENPDSRSGDLDFFQDSAGSVEKP